MISAFLRAVSDSGIIAHRPQQADRIPAVRRSLQKAVGELHVFPFNGLCEVIIDVFFLEQFRQFQEFQKMQKAQQQSEQTAVDTKPDTKTE